MPGAMPGLPIAVAMSAALFPTMTFKVILQDWWTDELTFVTVEDCKDMDDLINHCRVEFSNFDIQQIKEVN